MTDVTKELAAERVARNLFYLSEMLPPDQLDDFVDLVRRSLRRIAAATGSREDGWAVVRREALEALAYKEPGSNLPARGRLFSHFYAAVTYKCTTARLSENAHQHVITELLHRIGELEIEYKGHTIFVSQVRRQG